MVVINNYTSGFISLICSHSDTHKPNTHMNTHNTLPIWTHNQTRTNFIQQIHSYMHTFIHTQTFVNTRAHTCTALWVLCCATPLSFPCVLAVPSGWRWLMTAMARQIIWVAPSTQDVNQISFANDSQTLIWQARPEPYRVLHWGTKETSISPRMILFDHPFQGLMSIFLKISRWTRGTFVWEKSRSHHLCCITSVKLMHVWCVCVKLYGYASI